MSIQIQNPLKTTSNKITFSTVKWVIFYPLIIGVVCCPILFNQGYSDAESIRTLISTILQAQIAGVGIILSVTLIVIQMMASTYTSRGINLFRTDINIKLITTIFVGSILYGLLLLSSISSSNEGNIVITLFPLSIISPEWLVFFELMCGGATIPLMYAFVMGLVDIFHPEHMFKYLAQKVDTENVSSIFNPFQSHFDILFHAIENHDTTTINYGITQTISCFDDKMKTSPFRTVERNSHKFYYEIKKLEKKLFDADFDDSIVTLLIRIQDSIKSALKDPNDTLSITTSVKVDAICTIAKEAIHHHNTFVLSFSIEILGEIGRISIEKNSDRIYQHIAESCLNKILKIGRDISESNFKTDCQIRDKIITYTKYIGLKAINDNLEMAEIAPKNLAEFFSLFPSDDWRQKLQIHCLPILLQDYYALEEFTKIFEKHYGELQGTAVYDAR